MKQNNLLTTMLLLFALIAGSSSVWADETATFDFDTNAGTDFGITGTSSNSSTAGDITTNVSATINGVTVTITPSGGSTNNRFWNTSPKLRLYGGTMTVSAGTNTIKSIAFTVSSGKWNSSNTVSTGSVKGSSTSYTWSGSASSVVFTIAGNTQIKKFVVTYESASSDPSSSVAFANKTPSIDLKTTKIFSQNATAATGYDTSLITYDITTNSAGATISGSTVTVAHEGSVTVLATAPAVPGSFSESTATYTLTVNDTRDEANISWSSADDVNIAQGAADGDYTLPTLLNPNNLAVTYTITGTENLAIEVDGDILVDTDVLGSVTVTASYTGDAYKSKSVSYDINVYDPNVRDGSKYNPYNVADVIAFNENNNEKKSNVYVKGYIIGACNSGTGNLLEIISTNANIALSDTPTDTENYCILQLPQGDIRTALNALDKPYNVGVAQVLVKGNIERYCGKAGVKSPTEGSKIAEQVNITAAGMATYYTDCSLDFTDFADMYAYTATVSGDAITFTRVSKVPANTGVLLRNPNGAAAASQLVPVTTTPDDVTSVFVGTLTEIDALASEDGSYVNYILNNGTEGIGFYKANGQSLGVHKAYLHVAPNAARSFIGFSEDETTGISNVNRETMTNNRFYNLAGQSVAQPTKGMYIVNGKKVIIK